MFAFGHQWRHEGDVVRCVSLAESEVGSKTGDDVELPVVEIESTVQENEPLVDEGGLEQPPPFEQTATTTTTSRAACKETVILATVAVILSVFSYV